MFFSVRKTVSEVLKEDFFPIGLSTTETIINNKFEL